MALHVILSIAGPLTGFILSVILYLGKRNLDEMTNTLSKVQHTLTELRVEIPKSYVTKEELINHMHAEEQWHSHITQQLRDIRDELSSVRDWTHRS